MVDKTGRMQKEMPIDRLKLFLVRSHVKGDVLGRLRQGSVQREAVMA